MDRLHADTEKASPAQLREHGLLGTALHFKLNVVTKLERALRASDGKITFGAGLQKSQAAAGTILGLILDTTNTGTLIKEFADGVVLLGPSRGDRWVQLRTPTPTVCGGTRSRLIDVAPWGSVWARCDRVLFACLARGKQADIARSVSRPRGMD